MPLSAEQAFSSQSESHNGKSNVELTFDLDNPLLGDEWKKRITDKLNSIQDFLLLMRCLMATLMQFSITLS